MENIIRLWPTTREFAEDVGVNLNTAAAWRRRGNLPGKHDLTVVRAARARGYPVTLELLATTRSSHMGTTFSSENPSGAKQTVFTPEERKLNGK